MNGLSKALCVLYPIKCTSAADGQGGRDVDEAGLSRTGKDDQSASRILAPGGSVDIEGKPVGACPKQLR